MAKKKAGKKPKTTTGPVGVETATKGKKPSGPEPKAAAPAPGESTVNAQAASQKAPAARTITGERRGDLALKLAHVISERRGVRMEIASLRESIRSRNKKLHELMKAIEDAAEQIASGVEITEQAHLFHHEGAPLAKEPPISAGHVVIDEPGSSEPSRITEATAALSIVEIARRASPRVVCSWTGNGHQGAPAFPIVDGWFLDDRGQVVCKPCHDATDTPDAWPPSEILTAAPDKCGACGKPAVAAGVGFLCTDLEACAWSAIVGELKALDDVAEVPVAAPAAPTNGFDFDEREPAPPIDVAKAGPVAIEAKRADVDDEVRATRGGNGHAVDDIEAAALADVAETVGVGAARQ